MAEFDAELAWTWLEGRLAPLLAGHRRACADALARGVPLPPLPGELREPAVRRALACARAVAVPTAWWADAVLGAVEIEAEVAAAHEGEASWSALHTLAAARTRAAVALGGNYLDLVHRALGVTATPSVHVLPAADPVWDHVEALGPLQVEALAPLAAWRVVRGDAPRTLGGPGFATSALELGATTLAAWSRAHHERAHAALLLAGQWRSRVDDEAQAMAAQVRWQHELSPVLAKAAATGHRRAAAWATQLAQIEKALYAGERPAQQAPPPRALRDDPGAQAAYAEAAAQVGLLGA